MWPQPVPHPKDQGPKEVMYTREYRFKRSLGSPETEDLKAVKYPSKIKDPKEVKHPRDRKSRRLMSCTTKTEVQASHIRVHTGSPG